MVFTIPRFGDHVVDVNLHLLVHHVVKQGSHRPLVSGTGLFQTERHYFLTECDPPLPDMVMKDVFV